MTRKRTSASGTVTTENPDDLKQIKGIGPNFERQLHEAGILRFDQLASLTPAKVAVLIRSSSSEQIARQDWISQARKLASGRTSVPPRKNKSPKGSPAPGRRQHYATFTVELLLDEGNTVRRSRIAHIQSGEEDTWAGWHGMRLIDFFKKRAGMHLPEEKTAPKIIMPRKRTGKFALGSLKGTLDITNLSIIPANSRTPALGVPQGQPYTICLTLGLTKVNVPAFTPLEFKATIIAESVRGKRQLISEEFGAFPLTDSVTIELIGSSLPSDIYRLDALVLLTPLGADHNPRSGLMAFLESSPLEVY